MGLIVDPKAEITKVPHLGTLGEGTGPDQRVPMSKAGQGSSWTLSRWRRVGWGPLLRVLAGEWLGES